MYIQITDKCNMSCAHCCLSCTGKGSFMSQAVFDKALEIAKECSMDITLGGGEPTLHPKCVDWAMQAAIATVDVSMDMGGPAVLVVTNGSRTEIAIKLAKMAHMGMIAAEVSQDEWHDNIDDKVIQEFTRFNDRNRPSQGRERRGYAGIRDVTGGIKEQGRAEENGLADMKGCACSTLFISPNGDFYGCGCKAEKLGNILTDEIPQSYWDNADECHGKREEYA